MAVKQFTDENFQKEVLEADVPVLVDYHADWCVAPSTEIACDAREGRRADQIEAGDSLVSFGGSQLFSDQVLFSKTSSSVGHCKKIVTEAGREIEVTDNHPLWTEQGWKNAEEIEVGEKVAAVPMVTKRDKEEMDSKDVLLDEEIIKGVAFSSMRVDKYIKELKDKDLLPLRMNSELLPILARMMGWLFTDGTLYHKRSNNYRELSFVFGSEEDVEEFMEDLERLGFEGHVSKRSNKQVINGREFTSTTYRVKCLSTALWLVFKGLGVPEGNKTNQAYFLPEWLMGGTGLVKREFLAGFLGGDGPKLAMYEVERSERSNYDSLTINDLEFYKQEDLIDKGLEFGRQLAGLLGEFGVEIADVFDKPTDYVRKDGTKTRVVHLRFRGNYATGLALAENVGYVYCKSKSDSATYVGEFLRRIESKRRTWKEVYNKVVDFAKEGELSSVKIAQKFDLDGSVVWNWLEKDVKPGIRRHGEKFASWLKEATKGLKDGLVWDVVAQVEDVYLPAVQKISVDRHHSFVANGLVSHNCGPCKMAAPIIEELAEEYEGKVIIGKLDVDENQQIAAKFGVMSIPTVIVFKDGEEVDRLIGFRGREGYESLIEKQV